MAVNRNNGPQMKDIMEGDDEVMIMIVFGGQLRKRYNTYSVSSLYPEQSGNQPQPHRVGFGGVDGVCHSVYGDPVLRACFFFYLLMAYGVTKIFGQAITIIFGIRLDGCL